METEIDHEVSFQQCQEDNASHIFVNETNKAEETLDT